MTTTIPVRSTMAAGNAYAITPNDSSDLTYHARSLYVGTGGSLVVTLVNDTASVTFANVPSGTFLPIQVARVWNTGTTASNILGLI